MGMKLIAAALFASIAAFSQTPAQTTLAFDVASVKPAGPLDPMAIAQGKMRIGMKVDGQIVDIASFTLRDLIRTAYEVKDFQISGPDWLSGAMNAQRFNIQATMPDGATEKQVPQMLQALLAERFKLVIHHDTKEHSVMALVVAKGGPKMKESEPDQPPPETPEEPKKGETVLGQGTSQVRISGSMDNGKGVKMKGGPMGDMKMSMVDGKMHMEAAKMNMSALADFVTRFVDRPVVDMTELKGNYQAALDLTMDDLKNVARQAGMTMPGGPGGGDNSKGLVDASDPSGSSILMSLQAMGLKLEPRKAPLETIVIDHVEKTPTEN
jgi:uncharacterized protein (TIGR03435 family)